jgi:hypothetical protein
MTVSHIMEILRDAKRLAQEYRALMGKPLGVNLFKRIGRLRWRADTGRQYS